MKAAKKAPAPMRAPEAALMLEPALPVEELEAAEPEALPDEPDERVAVLEPEREEPEPEAEPEAAAPEVAAEPEAAELALT